MRAGLGALAGAGEVAGVDGGTGEVSDPRDAAAAARAPQLASLGAAGGGVAQFLEGVAAGDELPRPVGDRLQLARLEPGALPGAFEFAHPGCEPVADAVGAPGPGVQNVDDAPEQAPAFVGERKAVWRDALPGRCGRLADGGDEALRPPALVLPSSDPAAVRALRRAGRGPLAGPRAHHGKVIVFFGN